MQSFRNISGGYEKAEERIELGVFATKSDAELAHDLHMLRVQGLKSSGELNQDIALFRPKLARLILITKTAENSVQEVKKIEIKQEIDLSPDMSQDLKTDVEKRMNKSQSMTDPRPAADNISSQVNLSVEGDASTLTAVDSSATNDVAVTAVDPASIERTNGDKAASATDASYSIDAGAEGADALTALDDNVNAEKDDEEAQGWYNTPSVLIDLDNDIWKSTTKKNAQKSDLSIGGGSGMRKIDSDVVPIFDDPYRQNWEERVSTSYVTAVTYVYEVTFHHTNSLGLNLKPCFIPYAAGLAKRSIGCLIVMNTNNTLGTIVRPGDILLKINDQELASHVGVFNFDASTKMILRESAPRVVRFVRPGYGPLSPVEMLEMMKSTYRPMAKFAFNSDTSTSRAHLSTSYMDGSAPVSVRKSMSGQRVQWEFPGEPNVLQIATPSGKSTLKSKIPPFCDLGTSSSSMATIFTKRALLQSLISGNEAGVYRDRGKYATAIEYQGKMYYLGKYDTEDDALAVFKKYKLDLQKSGKFVPRKVRKIAGSMLYASDVYGVGEDEYLQLWDKKAGDDSIFYNLPEDGSGINSDEKTHESLKQELLQNGASLTGEGSPASSSVNPNFIFSNVRTF